MEDIHFEYDEKKEKINIRKHSISFQEAKTVFFDPNAKIISDPDHSQEEDRFIILGISRKLRLLVVCHCYKNYDGVIRIISARKATAKEIKYYGD
ncbi:MAG: BrnT family toxin [Endomicrobia bacterium]|nr:BrnT family toxin [Endomicrobiia bacterium]